MNSSDSKPERVNEVIHVGEVDLHRLVFIGDNAFAIAPDSEFDDWHVMGDNETDYRTHRDTQFGRFDDWELLGDFKDLPVDKPINQ